jgi:hypothetical protein
MPSGSRRSRKRPVIIHYPTDSSLLGDGVRVLTRVMKKVGAVAGAAGTALRMRRAKQLHPWFKQY